MKFIRHALVDALLSRRLRFAVAAVHMRHERLWEHRARTQHAVASSWDDDGSGRGDGVERVRGIRREIVAAISELAHFEHCVPQVGDVRDSFREGSGRGDLDLRARLRQKEGGEGV